MEKDVSDTPMKDDLDADATSTIDDQETHEQAKCDHFESPHPHSINPPFSTTIDDLTCLSILHNTISWTHKNSAIKLFSQLTNIQQFLRQIGY